MSKPIHKGFLQRYRKRFIGNNWRKEWVVLHEDSCLEWFKDEDESSLFGSILLKEAPEMIAAGPYANYVPGKPELQSRSDPNALLVVGNKKTNTTVWFLASNIDELSQWMTSISNTLPPPPDETKHNPNVQNSSTVPSAPPPPYSERPSNIGMQRNSQIQPPNSTGRNGANTVIIDRRNDGLGNFATGMMLGSALNGWGCGYGWGLGPRFGIGLGGWGHGMGYGYHGGTNVTNITNNINNQQDIDHSADNGTDGESDPQIGNTSAEPENGIDPGLDVGVDPNGFQPGFEPDAEFLPSMGEANQLTEANVSGLGDLGGYDGGGFDIGDFGGGGFGGDFGGGFFDGGGFDGGGGGFDF